MLRPTLFAVACLGAVVLAQPPKARVLSAEERQVLLQVIREASTQKRVTLNWSSSLAQHTLHYSSCKWHSMPEMYTTGNDKAATQATWVGSVESGPKTEGFLSEVQTIVEDWKKAVQRKPRYFNYDFYKKPVMKLGCSYTNRCKRIVNNRFTSFAVLACKFA